MIEVNHLTKQYGTDGRPAVDDLNFKIAGNRVIGFLGPNGAGKSTTMNMLTGCLAPTSGTVRINGFDMADDPVRAKKCIGYLPEIPPLYTDMTPREFLGFVASARGVNPADLDGQVRQALELTGLTGVRDRLIRALSKGYRQRVGIAMTLLGDPDTIILDEPTVGLDPAQILEIRGLIRKLGERKTVIISSHILAEISELCDHVLILSHGRLVANDSVENLRASLESVHLLRLSVRGDEEAVANVLRSIDGIREFRQTAAGEIGATAWELQIESDPELRDRIFFAMAQERLAVLSMEATEPDLETIFLSLTAPGTPAAQQPNVKDGPDAPNEPEKAESPEETGNADEKKEDNDL